MSEKTGKIKWYSFNKGYGFIQMPDQSKDVFIHVNELQKSGIKRGLTEGEMVKFVSAMGHKGEYATQISIVERPK